MNQCVLAVTEQISEFFCVLSTDNLWRYKEHGLEGVLFWGAKPMKFEQPPKKMEYVIENEAEPVLLEESEPNRREE